MLARYQLSLGTDGPDPIHVSERRPRDGPTFQRCSTLSRRAARLALEDYGRRPDRRFVPGAAWLRIESQLPQLDSRPVDADTALSRALLAERQTHSLARQREVISRR